MKIVFIFQLFVILKRVGDQYLHLFFTFFILVVRWHKWATPPGVLHAMKAVRNRFKIFVKRNYTSIAIILYKGIKSGGFFSQQFEENTSGEIHLIFLFIMDDVMTLELFCVIHTGEAEQQFSTYILCKELK